MFNARTERMSMLSSVVRQICWYALHVVMTLCLSDQYSHLNCAERRVRDMDARLNRAKKPGVGLRYAYIANAFPFSADSEVYSCGPHFWIPKIAWAPSAPDRNLKGRRIASGTVLTLFACKNNQYIHLSMTYTFCPVIFCRHVLCIHGLFKKVPLMERFPRKFNSVESATHGKIAQPI